MKALSHWEGGMCSRPQVQEQPRQRCRDDQVVRPSGRARGLEKKVQGRIHHGRFRRVYFQKSGCVKSGLPRVCLPDKSTPPSTSLTVHFCLVRVRDVLFTGELFCEGKCKCKTVSCDWWYWDDHPTRLEEVARKQMQPIVLFVRDTERWSPQGRFLVFVQSLYFKFLYSVLTPIFFHLCCFYQMNSESHMKHTYRHTHTLGKGMKITQSFSLLFLRWVWLRCSFAAIGKTIRKSIIKKLYCLLILIFKSNFHSKKWENKAKFNIPYGIQNLIFTVLALLWPLLQKLNHALFYYPKACFSVYKI